MSMGGTDPQKNTGMYHTAVAGAGVGETRPSQARHQGPWGPQRNSDSKHSTGETLPRDEVSVSLLVQPLFKL